MLIFNRIRLTTELIDCFREASIVGESQGRVEPPSPRADPGVTDLLWLPGMDETGQNP